MTGPQQGDKTLEDLNEEYGSADGDIAAGKKSTVSQLIDISSCCELFHDEDGKGYAVIVGPIRQVWPIRSQGFTDWLQLQYLQQKDRAASTSQCMDALHTIEAKARLEGEKRQVHIRVADLRNRVILDLCDEAWRVVEITASGWKILQKAPVPFIRYKGMAALPVPADHGDLSLLASYINLDADGLILTKAWLLAALRGRGPFPILILGGEQGSGKSSIARVVRSLIDPSSTPLRSPPRNEHDLAIQAGNSYAICLDNLSSLAAHMSDAMCRLATGGGFSKRALYTDQEEVLIHFVRPVILNGIDEFATRPDLLDRGLILRSRTIRQVRDEADFWLQFDKDRPALLGGLLDALADTLSREGKVVPPELPRMADFALLGTAAESALGLQARGFMGVYRRNIRDGMATSIDASPFATALVDFMDSRGEWEGIASELLDDLESVVDDRTSKARNWPRAANKVRGQLQRLAPSLRATGIDVEFLERTGSRRPLRIVNTRQLSSSSSQSSQIALEKTAVDDDTNDDSSHRVGVASSPVSSNSALYDGNDDSDDHMRDSPVVCPRCDGEGCKHCGLRGTVSLTMVVPISTSAEPFDSGRREAW